MDKKRKEQKDNGQKGEFYESIDPFVDNCILLFVMQSSTVLILFVLAFLLASTDFSRYAVFAIFITPIVFFPYSYNLLNLQSFRHMSAYKKIRNLAPITLILIVINIILGIYDSSIVGQLIVIQIAIGLFPLLFLVSKKFKFMLTNGCKSAYLRIFYGNQKLSHLRILKIRFVPYYMCLTLWVVFIAIVPNLVFMKHYYETEKTIHTVYQESGVVADIKQKLYELDSMWSEKPILNNQSMKKFFLEDSSSCLYGMRQFSVSLQDTTQLDTNLKSGHMLSGLNFTRSTLTKYGARTNGLLKYPRRFSLDDRQVTLKSKYADESSHELSPIIVKSNKTFNIPFGRRIWFGGLVFFLIIVGLIYQLVKFISNKLFAVNSVINYELTQNFRSHLDPNQHYLIWNAGLDKSEKILGIEHSENELYKSEKLDYIDAVLEDPDAFLTLIKELEQKVKSNHQVLLVSSFSREALDDLIEKKVELESQNESQDNRPWLQAKIEWNNFEIVLSEWIVPVQQGITNESSVQILARALIDHHFENKEESAYIKFKNSLIMEFGQSKELVEIGKNLESYINKYHPTHTLSFEEIIMKVEQTASGFYHRLWASCSKVEKFVLYDLAKDGYVNTLNKEPIYRLCQKGLITCQGSLNIMNESFRNFIHNNMEPELIKEIDKNVAERGRWNKFRAPLIIALIAVGAFIFVTQEEVFSKSIAFLTTILTVIPALLRFIPSSKNTVPPANF